MVVSQAANGPVTKEGKASVEMSMLIVPDVESLMTVRLTVPLLMAAKVPAMHSPHQHRCIPFHMAGTVPTSTVTLSSPNKYV